MPDNKPRIKLRATVSIDIDATDYLDAARVQQEMESLCESLSAKYVGCSYELRERRDRGEPAAPAHKQTRPRRTRNKRPSASNSSPTDTEPEQEAAA